LKRLAQAPIAAGDGGLVVSKSSPMCFPIFFPMFFQISFHSFPIVSNVAHIFSKLPICFMFHSFLQFSPSFPTNPRLSCNLVFGTSESHNSVWEIRKKNSPVFEGMTAVLEEVFQPTIGDLSGKDAATRSNGGSQGSSHDIHITSP
jgi:hypothetical protein